MLEYGASRSLISGYIAVKQLQCCTYPLNEQSRKCVAHAPVSSRVHVPQECNVTLSCCRCSSNKNFLAVLDLRLGPQPSGCTLIVIIASIGASTQSEGPHASGVPKWKQIATQTPQLKMYPLYSRKHAFGVLNLRYVQNECTQVLLRKYRHKYLETKIAVGRQHRSRDSQKKSKNVCICYRYCVCIRHVFATIPFAKVVGVRAAGRVLPANLPR